MITKEEYKRELIRMWDSVRGDNLKKGEKDCNTIKCEDCQFNSIPLCNKGISAFEMIEIVEKWSKEHPLKKFKVSKLEYDIIRAAIDYSSEEEAFKDVDILYELLINGYFQGATRDMTINYYFDNCEVMEDDTDKR